MTFEWQKKNVCCSALDSGQRLSSVSAPLIIQQRPSCIWLFTRSTPNGSLDVHRGDGQEGNWLRRQQGLEEVRSSDSPGGASSSDSRTMLLVYVGFWRSHLLWALWRREQWVGNQPIIVKEGEASSRLHTNGRGPAVLFHKQLYWVFYVDEEHRLCSTCFEKVDGESGQPLWQLPRCYSCPTVSDGRPCALAAQDDGKDYIYVCYNSGGGLACLQLSPGSETLQVYSTRPGHLEPIRGTPTVLFYTKFHLFYRGPGRRLCWYIAQDPHRWVQASDSELLQIESSHACVGYKTVTGQLILLSPTQPPLLQELRGDYREKPALRLSELHFRA